MSSIMFGSPRMKDEPDSDMITTILDEMHTCSKKNILQVKNNLDDIYGSYSDEKKKGLNQLHKHLMVHLNTFFEEVVTESDKDKDNIIKEIEDLLVEKEILEKELQMKIPIDERNDATPLIDVQISIDKALQGCRQIKEERMTELHHLQNEEKQICMLLNEKPKYSGITDMPSATQLETMKHHLVDLKNTQIKRRSTFLEQKTKIESLFFALEEVPILQFDKMVLGDPDQFQLSESNLDELQKLIKRLEDQTENQKCMAIELRSKLSSLWGRLQIDVTYQNNFVEQFTGFGKTVINKLKMEVERCETLKKDNIKQFIEKLRDELNQLWNKCHFGERQKKQCHVYYNNECNEDVMDLLDIEVDNVKKFYNDNIDIFNLIEDRECLWNKMIMMKQQATDPGRLWQNRGGQLLKEEKERKIIQKELPKVEKKLKALLNAYEEREGKFFIYNDERLLNVMEKQWSVMKSSQKKEPAKSKIQSGIKAQTPQTVTRSKRKFATTSSNQPSKVRKIDMEHKAMVAPKRQLTFQHNNVATLVPLNSTKLNGVNLTTTKQYTTCHGSSDENVSVESYANFQEHLESNKKKMLFPSPTTNSVLRERNIYTHATPKKLFMKTPTKASQIPIPSSTSKTPIRTTPRMMPNTRSVTRLTRTLNNKLPIIF